LIAFSNDLHWNNKFEQFTSPAHLKLKPSDCRKEPTDGRRLEADGETIMSTLVLASAPGAVAAAEPNAKPSLFQRLIEARARDALRRIHAFLAVQSDRRLQDLGYTAADIEVIRQGRSVWPSR
jgi:hypothetical protein